MSPKKVVLAIVLALDFTGCAAMEYRSLRDRWLWP